MPEILSPKILYEKHTRVWECLTAFSIFYFRKLEATSFAQYLNNDQPNEKMLKPWHTVGTFLYTPPTNHHWRSADVTLDWKKIPGFPTTAAGSQSGSQPVSWGPTGLALPFNAGVSPERPEMNHRPAFTHATHAGSTRCRHLAGSGGVQRVLKVARWGFKGGGLLRHCKESCCHHKAPFMFFRDTQPTCPHTVLFLTKLKMRPNKRWVASSARLQDLRVTL